MVRLLLNGEKKDNEGDTKTVRGYQVSAILIVGGGRAAVMLLDHFSSMNDKRVVGVCDPNPEAPGCLKASSLGIKTFRDFTKVVAHAKVEVIIELTGNAKVREAVIAHMRPEQELMSSGCARIMCEMIGARAEAADHISNEFRDIGEQLQGLMGNVENAQQNIEQLLRELTMVSLNASLEAARAGVHGAAFATVVQRIREMVEKAHNSTDEISTAAKASHGVLEGMARAEGQLRERIC